MPSSKTPSVKRPHVTLSWAQTLNGAITAQRGRPTPISCPETRQLTHQIRARSDGILVGIGTILADDPRLTVRLVAGENPRPIVLDSHLRCPLEANVVANRPIFAVSRQHDRAKAATLEAQGCTVLELPRASTGIALDTLLPALCELGITRLMVEGGGQVLGSFLMAGCVDELVITLSTRLMNGYAPAGCLPQPLGLRQTSIKRCGSDFVLRGTL